MSEETTKMGFIVLYRAFTNWEWYDDALSIKLFIHLILTVNWEDKQWRGQTIKRGQIVTSLNNLSAATNMTIPQLRKRISNLKSTGEIVTTSSNRFSIITVVKYDEYQDLELRKASRKQSKDKRIATTKPLNKSNTSITIGERKKTFIDDIKNCLIENDVKYPSAMLNEFAEYWTEAGPRDKKMRFEKQTSFDINRRLKTWNKKRIMDTQKGKL